MQQPLELFYRGGLWIKAANGAVELLGGVLLVIAPAGFLHRIVRCLNAHDRRRTVDRLSGMLARGVGHLANDGRGFALFYLFSHGLVKVVLAALLLQGQRAAVPFGIVIFGLLIGYELYRLVLRPGVLLGAIVLVDLAILTLIVLHGAHGGA